MKIGSFDFPTKTALFFPLKISPTLPLFEIRKFELADLAHSPTIENPEFKVKMFFAFL